MAERPHADGPRAGRRWPLTLTALALAVALAALVLLALRAANGTRAGNGDGPPSDAASRSPVVLGGPETWTVGGRSVQIRQTLLLDLQEGLQVTIVAEHRFGPSFASLTDDDILPHAMPLMQHAVQSGLHQSPAVQQVGGRSVERIGVVLVEGQGPQARAYRIARPLSQIAAGAAD